MAGSGSGSGSGSGWRTIGGVGDDSNEAKDRDIMR